MFSDLDIRSASSLPGQQFLLQEEPLLLMALRKRESGQNRSDCGSLLMFSSTSEELPCGSCSCGCCWGTRCTSGDSNWGSGLRHLQLRREMALTMSGSFSLPRFKGHSSLGVTSSRWSGPRILCKGRTCATCISRGPDGTRRKQFESSG